MCLIAYQLMVQCLKSQACSQHCSIRRACAHVHMGNLLACFEQRRRRSGNTLLASKDDQLSFYNGVIIAGVICLCAIGCSFQCCALNLGLENSPPSFEGSSLVGHSALGSCGLPQKLAGWWPQAQSGQPGAGSCAAMRAAGKVRPTCHCLCHRYATSAQLGHKKIKPSAC